METLDKIKKCWGDNKDLASALPLDKELMEKMVRSKVRKEKRVMVEYFWASFVYQIMVYAMASHLVIKYWGNTSIVGWAIAGMLLYLPFTIVLLRKFQALCLPALSSVDSPAQSLRTNIQRQYTLMSGFFRFKKGFDWLGMPLSAAIIVIVLFNLYADGGIASHITGAVTLFALVLTAFVTATYLENRKRFITPIRKLELVLRDLESL